MTVTEKQDDRLGKVEKSLFTDSDIHEGVIAKAMCEISRHKVDFADIYFQCTEHESWTINEGIIFSAGYGTDKGVGVRAVSGEKTAYAYSNTLNNKELLSAANIVRSIGEIGEEKSVSLVTSNDHPVIYTSDNPLLSLDSDAKVDLLKKLDRWARLSDPRVKEVTGVLSMVNDHVLIIKSDGRQVYDIRPLVRLSVTVIMQEDDQRQTGSSGGGGRVLLSYFTDEKIKEYVGKAVRDAEIKLQARDLKAGEMEVVLGSGWSGVLLHEAVGHGLEADFNRKGTSNYTGLVGQKVAASCVTIVDQGNIPGRRGSLNVDDEGNPTGRTVLIENGILKGYLQDETNSRLMKQPLTGNGRRESYASSPLPRMTNTFMEAGQYESEEIISSIKDGIYVESLSGGSVDITSGRFVFNMNVAWYVQNGKKQYPVKNATLIGNGPDVMRNVTMVGNNLELDPGVGVCGKDGQSVYVGVGQPTLKVSKGLVVGGSVTQ